MTKPYHIFYCILFCFQAQLNPFYNLLASNPE